MSIYTEGKPTSKVDIEVFLEIPLLLRQVTFYCRISHLSGVVDSKIRFEA